MHILSWEDLELYREMSVEFKLRFADNPASGEAQDHVVVVILSEWYHGMW